MGADLLDLKVPSWRNEIDWDNLKMQSCRWCILGQLFGRFARGDHSLRCSILWGTEDKPFGVAYGFKHEQQKDIAALNFAWLSYRPKTESPEMELADDAALA